MLKMLHQDSWSLDFPTLIFLLVAALLSSCGPTPGTGTSSLQIIRGYSPAPDHPAASSGVALVAKDSHEHFCSGTIVAQNLVITAAHCVFDRRPEDFALMFGPQTKDSQSIYRAVVAKQTYKRVQKFESNFDIAWVQFEGHLPSGFKAIEIWHDPSILKSAFPLTLAGYGRTATLCQDSDPFCQGGRLFAVDTSLHEFVDQARLFNLIIIRDRDGRGPCFGDSGGPAYLFKNGQWYLAGNFVGWDRSLVKETVQDTCEQGEAIYNFVGKFVDWIEKSSGNRLDFNEKLNPMMPDQDLDVLVVEPNSFNVWCAYNNHEDPAWYTVQRIIRQVSDALIESGNEEGGREVYRNCSRAEFWLQKMLSERRTLSLSSFSPDDFTDKLSIEDLRPLKVLGEMGLEELELVDQRIPDLRPLAALKKLKKLAIINNLLEKNQGASNQDVLALTAFPSLESVLIQNSMVPIKFSGMEQLVKLRSVDLSYVEVDSLMGLELLRLESLRIDSIKIAESLDLTHQEAMKDLYLNGVELAGLPKKMANLEALNLLEVTGLSSLPAGAPKLKTLFVYASDFRGELRFGSWPSLEEVAIFSNKKLTKISGIEGLIKLNHLDLSENGLDSIAIIRDLPQLSHLNLAKNLLVYPPILSQLPSLAKLNLENNKLLNLEGLGGLPRLEYLNLSHNPWRNLHDLAQVPSIKNLVVQNSKGLGLMSLDGIDKLSQLRELNLAHNSIHKLDGLLRLFQLEVLVLSDNYIDDIGKLIGLTQLQFLEVANNPLKTQQCPIASKPEVCRFE